MTYNVHSGFIYDGMHGVATLKNIKTHLVTICGKTDDSCTESKYLGLKSILILNII